MLVKSDNILVERLDQKDWIEWGREIWNIMAKKRDRDVIRKEGST